MFTAQPYSHALLIFSRNENMKTSFSYDKYIYERQKFSLFIFLKQYSADIFTGLHLILTTQTVVYFLWHIDIQICGYFLIKHYFKP